MHNVSLRKLEQIVKRDFGLTSKQVLRRARTRGIAAQLCSAAVDAEAEQLMLRYFDQSHLIRECAAFFGATQSTFCAAPRPLMARKVETREARRLEGMNRIAPCGQRHWSGSGD